MKPKSIVAMRVSSQIHAIEDSLDTLLGKTGELIAEISTARVDHAVDANEMQRVLFRLVGAQTALIEARKNSIGAHSDLKKFAEPRADFPFGCPESGEGAQDDTLRIVG